MAEEFGEELIKRYNLEENIAQVTFIEENIAQVTFIEDNIFLQIKQTWSLSTRPPVRSKQISFFNGF